MSRAAGWLGLLACSWALLAQLPAQNTQDLFLEAERSLNAGDREAARRAFEQLKHLRLSDAASHYNLGFLAENLGEIERAASEYEAAIRLDPTEVDFYLDLGTLFLSHQA